MFVNRLVPMGTSGVRVSGFDLAFPFVALCSVHVIVRTWKPVYNWIAAFAVLLTLHSILMAATGDLNLSTIVRDTIKIIYALAAIIVLSAIFSELFYAQLPRRSQLIVGVIFLAVAFTWAHLNRASIDVWRSAGSGFTPPTPVALAALILLCLFLVNLYYFKAKDTLILLFVHPALSIFATIFVKDNSIEGFYIPTLVSIIIPYGTLFVTLWKRKQHGLAAIAIIWIAGAFAAFMMYTGLPNIVAADIRGAIAITQQHDANACSPTGTADSLQIGAIDVGSSLSNSSSPCPLNVRSGVSSRFVMWTIAIESIIAHPVLGIGAGQIPDGYADAMARNGWSNESSIHNTVLTLVMWYGLLGIIMIAAVILLVILSVRALGIMQAFNVYVVLAPFVAFHDIMGIRAVWILLAIILAQVVMCEKSKPQRNSLI